MKRSIRVEAKFSCLSDLLQLLRSPDIEPPVIARAGLAIEELFANTIHHAYGEESDHPVWLDVEINGNHLHISYADAGAEFDPFANLARLDQETNLDSDHRHVGGLGRILVHHMARYCSYRRENGRNVIALEYELRQG